MNEHAATHLLLRRQFLANCANNKKHLSVHSSFVEALPITQKVNHAKEHLATDTAHRNSKMLRICSVTVVVFDIDTSDQP